jgi:hypothetical protein
MPVSCTSAALVTQCWKLLQQMQDVYTCVPLYACTPTANYLQVDLFLCRVIKQQVPLQNKCRQQRRAHIQKHSSASRHKHHVTLNGQVTATPRGLATPKIHVLIRYSTRGVCNTAADVCECRGVGWLQLLRCGSVAKAFKKHTDGLRLTGLREGGVSCCWVA